MASPSPSRVPAWQLWHPRQEIRFAGTQQQGQPLYPDLSGFSRTYTSGSVPPVEDQLSSGPSEVPEPRPSQPDQTTAPSVLQSVKTSPGEPLPAALSGEDGDASAKGQNGPLDGPSLEPPYPALDYAVLPKLFEDAKKAKPESPESYWTYGLYRGPDGEKVKVHYSKSMHTTERVCQYFLDEKVIGFDLEWMPDAQTWQGPRRNVCLIQMASQSRVALFHLSLYPRSDLLVAPSLKKIMEDPNITKTGVWISGDCTRLRNYLKIDSRGLFELSHMHKLVTHSASGETHLINKRLVTLAEQVNTWLRLPMYKGQGVRSSDWSKPLTMDQIIYSSSDAYAAVQLYAIMDHHRKLLQPTPPLPHHAELKLPIRLADAISESANEEGVDEAEPIEETNDLTSPLSSSESARLVTDAIEVECEIEDKAETSPAPKAPGALPQNVRKASTKKPADTKQQDERVVAADVWVADYSTKRAKPSRIGRAPLRAFHIWRSNHDLDPSAVAGLLRDPPLQTATVRNYILDTIKSEKLSFEPARLRSEVVDHIPEMVLTSKYKSVVKSLEKASTAPDAGPTITG